MIDPTPGELVRVLLMLLLGGVVYDRFVVDVIETRLPPGHGVTAYEVAGGVLFTLIGLMFVTSLETFILALLCFAASGLPMILGAHARRVEIGR
jgi:hypothetical protein